jgi:glucan phosphoethanolaminetransferase (alkaline phosphatase superfamily)
MGKTFRILRGRARGLTVAAKEIESNSAIRSAGLLGVFVMARLLTGSGMPMPASLWTPVAYLWQDVAVVLVFLLIDYVVRREWFGWTLYGLVVTYVALNVPITRVLSSPLTLTMLRAAGGPLADSVRHYLTANGLEAIALTLAAAVFLPMSMVRWKPRRGIAQLSLILSVAVVASGPYANSKVDTAGRYRNAIGALWPAHIRETGNLQQNRDWRVSPFPASSTAGEPLRQYRGDAARRNVVMVLLESTAARYWPIEKSSDDPMPNLTALAAHGISFEHAYAVYPESIKGLLSVLCSRYPAFGVEPDAYAGITCPALPQQLRNAGYRTALFHSGRFMYLGMPSIIENRGFEVLEDAGTIGGNVHSSFGIDDSSTVKRILSWIDSLKSGERFFVTYLPVSGHHPYTSPQPANDDLHRYLNALTSGDRALGELLDGLRSRNLDGNTLYFVFGDHGEAFGQHDGNFGHTLFIYDENVHVPFVIAAPGLIQDQIRISNAASLIDTAPTLLDLLGLPAAAEFQGTSLLDANTRMSLFFTDYSLGWLGLYDACHKFLFETGSARSRLYNVCNDPGETVDLSSREANRISAYRSRLEEWIAAQQVTGGKSPMRE